jgi:hypothetical protein
MKYNIPRRSKMCPNRIFVMKVYHLATLNEPRTQLSRLGRRSFRNQRGFISKKIDKLKKKKKKKLTN